MILSINSWKNGITKEKKVLQMQTNKSKTQLDADYLRKKNSTWKWGVWTVWNLSNRRVKMLFGKKKVAD